MRLQKDVDYNCDVMLWFVMIRMSVSTLMELVSITQNMCELYLTFYHWDFQSKLQGDDSILYDLIRDSEMTYHLKQILHYYTYSDGASTATAKLTELLNSLGDIDNYDDDEHVIDTMIEKLNPDRTGWVLNGLPRCWWDDVQTRLAATHLYLRKLRKDMALDEFRVGHLQ